MTGSSSPSASGAKVFLRRQSPLGLKEQFRSLNDILFVGFNQNYSCFVCGTESGFKVYSCDSLEQKLCRVTAGEGLGIVEMLLKSNVFALVGGGKKPRYSPKTVMLYNDEVDRCFGELAYRSPVRAVKLQPNIVVVVLEFKIYVYSFGDLKLLCQLETLSNIKGLCAISSAASAGVLACPSECTGEVKIKLFGSKTTMIIQAHETSLACIALNLNGSLLATASTKGTLVNVFRTADGTKLQELRRGADQADIFSMAFSANSQWFVLSSCKGTVHIFSIKANELVETRHTEGTKLASSEGGSRLFRARSTLLSFGAATAGSSLSYVKGVMSKYFSSERSLCQFRLPRETRAIVRFGPEKNTIIVVCRDGSVYKCSFDPVKGGSCQIVEHFSLTESANVEAKQLA